MGKNKGKKGKRADQEVNTERDDMTTGSITVVAAGSSSSALPAREDPFGSKILVVTSLKRRSDIPFLTLTHNFNLLAGSEAWTSEDIRLAAHLYASLLEDHERLTNEDPDRSLVLFSKTWKSDRSLARLQYCERVSQAVTGILEDRSINEEPGPTLTVACSVAEDVEEFLRSDELRPGSECLASVQEAIDRLRKFTYDKRIDTPSVDKLVAYAMNDLEVKSAKASLPTRSGHKASSVERAS